MDLSAIASYNNQSNISDSGISQSASNDILKRAINIDQTNAQQLLQAIPPANQTGAVPNLPSNLGQNVNTVA